MKKYIYSKFSTFSIFKNRYKQKVKKINNLIIINQYFPPDFASTGQLIDELINSFKNENFQIKILTGMPAYHYKTKFAKPVERNQNHTILRSRFSRIIPKKFKGKIINSLLYCLRVLSHLIFLRESNNLALYTSEPAYLPIFAWLFSKITKIPYILLIYDIYPEILKSSKFIKKENLIFKIWKKLNKFSFDNAKEIIVLSKDMKNKIKNNYFIPLNKITVIPSWADPEFIYPIKTENNYFLKNHKLNDHFIVLYSGNQGRCHDLKTLIKAAEILKDKQNILFLFVGDGFQNKYIKEKCNNQKISNCIFLPFQEKKHLPYILSSASIGVVSVQSDLCGLIAPSKLYGHLACGTPIALITDKKSYLKKLVEKNSCGKWVANGDYSDLANWILEMYTNQTKLKEIGQSSLNLFYKEFTLDKISKKYLKTITRNFN